MKLDRKLLELQFTLWEMSADVEHDKEEDEKLALLRTRQGARDP